MLDYFLAYVTVLFVLMFLESKVYPYLVLDCRLLVDYFALTTVYDLFLELTFDEVIKFFGVLSCSTMRLKDFCSLAESCIYVIESLLIVVVIIAVDDAS